MILVGNQRGGAKDLAAHLLKQENERVQVHELRGFVADDLHGALQESYAVSRGTKCKQHLFSLSLNPPPEETVDVGVFEDAVDKAEERLGLTGQPRAIVFHEKNGRRHAHAVWSRIDIDEMKAVQLSHSKTKLQEVAREIYVERGWQMPRGFISREFTDPSNFTLEEWQQAKRADKDPKQIKAIFQDCWATSDSRAGFAHALEERGYILAKGDRRGFVAVDHTGEAYAVARWVGLKTKQVKDRFGSPDDLPSVDQAHARAARQITIRLRDLRKEQAQAALKERERFQQERRSAEERQQSERDRLAKVQRERQTKEEAEREARMRKGLLGFWDRLTGKRRQVEQENAVQAALACKRDQMETSRLAQTQRETITAIDAKKVETLGRSNAITRELRDDIRDLKKDADRTSALPRPEPSRPKRVTAKKERSRRSRDGPER